MDRERLTITLRKDILKRLDQIIDGVNMRNRSHAIESLLTRSLTPKINQAVILAGGEGIKLRPLTYEVPKALIPVAGKPILEHVIELLRDAEIRTIVLAVGHLGHKIKEHFGNGSKFGIEIHYSQESHALGTAGALKLAKASLHGGPFVVLHGDILVDINISELISFHQDQHVVGTLALTTSSETSEYGMVLLRGSKIVDFIEKPSKKEATSRLINSGIYVFEEDIFNFISGTNEIQLEDIFPVLAKEGKLGGFSFEGRWLDVSTPKAYEEAIKLWSKRKR